MSGFNLDGYVTVNDRMIAFFDKYPQGSIQTRPAEIVSIEDKTFIRTVAEVYRTPDDPRPGIGEAWELFPGKTPYTRDSEAMNSGTSAIGRAILAIGVGFSDKGVASADEVHLAQERRSETGDGPAPKTGAKKWKATEKQIGAVQRMAAHIPYADRMRLIEAITTKSTWDDLTGDDIDLLFQIKSSGLTDRYQALKSIWAEETPEDDPWAVEGM